MGALADDRRKTKAQTNNACTGLAGTPAACMVKFYCAASGLHARRQPVNTPNPLAEIPLQTLRLF